MAASTLSRVSGRTFGCSFRTRETVWCDTPASRATSAMTGGLDRLPVPGTTDVLTRLLACSPGDDVTSCLLCRARCGAMRIAGTDVSANGRADQTAAAITWKPPTATCAYSRPPGFLVLQRSRRTATAVAHDTPVARAVTSGA